MSQRRTSRRISPEPPPNFNSGRDIPAFTLSVRSETRTEDLFTAAGTQPVTLRLRFEYADGNYTSPAIDGSIAVDPAATKRVRQRLGGELATSFAPLVLLCFAVWGSVTTGGVVTRSTVCSTGCLYPYSCLCGLPGAGACLGWQPCTCRLIVFGVPIPSPWTFLVLILVLVLLGILLM